MYLFGFTFILTLRSLSWLDFSKTLRGKNTVDNRLCFYCAALSRETIIDGKQVDAGAYVVWGACPCNKKLAYELFGYL